MEYYATRNDVLVHAKTRNHLENMLSERIQLQKATYYDFTYMKCPEVGKTLKTGDRLVVT